MFQFLIDSSQNNYLELNGNKYYDENGHGRALNPSNTTKLISFKSMISVLSDKY